MVVICEQELSSSSCMSLLISNSAAAVSLGRGPSSSPTSPRLHAARPSSSLTSRCLALSRLALALCLKTFEEVQPLKDMAATSCHLAMALTAAHSGPVHSKY